MDCKLNVANFNKIRYIWCQKWGDCVKKFIPITRIISEMKKRVSNLLHRVEELESSRPHGDENNDDRLRTLEETLSGQADAMREMQQAIQSMSITISSYTAAALYGNFHPPGCSTMSPMGLASPRNGVNRTTSQPAANSGTTSTNPSDQVVSGHGASSTASVAQQSRTAISNSKKVKASSFDGSGSVEDYLVQFEVVALANGWTDGDKGEMLASLLRGPAVSALAHLPAHLRLHYDSLVDTLKRRFGEHNVEDVSHAKLQNRYQGATEKLPDFAADIWKLTQRAFPDCPLRAQDRIAMRHFVNGIANKDVQFHLRLSRCVGLNDALTMALEVEACAMPREQKRNIRVAEVSVSTNAETQTEPRSETRRRWQRRQNQATNQVYDGAVSGNEETPARRS